MTEIFYNGSFITTDSQALTPLSMAAMYGKGVFTTVAVYRSELFLWEKHQNRLLKDAAAVGLDVSGIDAKLLNDAVHKTFEQNGLINGRVRITLFDETPAAIWLNDGSAKTSVMINASEFRQMPESFVLGISPYRINTASPLAGVKSCNYLENVIAINEAKSKGWHEAVRLNDRGEVAGGCMSNIFWAKGDQLFTPHLSTGCLAGTTREFVLENSDCNEVAATIDELENADSIFLTSAGIGITAVKVFKDKPLNTIYHEILEMLPGI